MGKHGTSESADASKFQIEKLMDAVRTASELEMLCWFMKICSSSLNLAHARRAAQIRFEEIESQIRAEAQKVK